MGGIVSFVKPNIFTFLGNEDLAEDDPRLEIILQQEIYLDNSKSFDQTFQEIYFKKPNNFAIILSFCHNNFKNIISAYENSTILIEQKLPQMKTIIILVRYILPPMIMARDSFLKNNQILLDIFLQFLLSLHLN